MAFTSVLHVTAFERTILFFIFFSLVWIDFGYDISKMSKTEPVSFQSNRWNIELIIKWAAKFTMYGSTTSANKNNYAEFIHYIRVRIYTQNQSAQINFNVY